MVEHWFVDWYDAHRAIHRERSLPDPEAPAGEALAKAWIAAFRRRGLHERSVADEASSRLAEKRHFPADHLAELLDLADAAKAERAAAAAGPAAPAPDPTRLALLRSRWAALPEAERASIRAAAGSDAEAALLAELARREAEGPSVPPGEAAAILRGLVRELARRPAAGAPARARRAAPMPAFVADAPPDPRRDRQAAALAAYAARKGG